MSSMTTTPSLPTLTYSSDLLGKFSRLPRADIILRSSDSYDFFVQKLHVVDSSPVLEEQIMCQVVGPESTSAAFCEAATVKGETKDGLFLPVVQLAEGHAIISSLLTFVFPVLPVLPPTIEQILELLSVAEKYEMTAALIRIRDCASRREPPFICPENAFHVYSLARKYGLLKETLEAAEETLKSPMTIQDLDDNFQLDVMPSVALYELWQYRQRVLGNLNEELHSDAGVYQILFDANLDCAGIEEDGEIPPWIHSYLITLLNDPARFDLTKFHLSLSSHVSETGFDRCEPCNSISSETIGEFWTALTTAVRESTRKAGSDFSFTEGEIRFQCSTSATIEVSPLPEGRDMQGADVILRSSDLVSFRVHKLILAISSPFFNDMFSLPQPCDDNVEDGLPVVHVSEDAELLHSLLTMLYPIPSMIPDSHEKNFALLAALQKYEMSAVLSTVRSEIGRQLLTTAAPFRAYAIARSKRLFPEMEAAARLTLDHPLTFAAIGDALPLFEGTALHDLVSFRKRCRDKLVSFFQGFVDGSDGLSTIWFGCGKTESPPPTPQSDNVKPAEWLSDLILQHIKSLQKAYTGPLPKPSSLRKEFVNRLLMHLLSPRNCSCSVVYVTEGEAFLHELSRRVWKARHEEPFLLGAEVSNATGDLGMVNG